MKHKKRIQEIKNPKQKRIKIATKSVLIGRLDREKKGDHFKTAIIRLFEVNNPHKKNVFPTKIYKFTNVEKVRIRKLNVSYYLEGNDIVVNDLEELYMIREGSKLTLKAYQFEVEKRGKENE
ncbi:hypothetical protein AYK26_01365 [Euryarchaeota archaeon SM23-78]|nr:MAG: hypothetical protein AYK26_01365 [Euryarchaeota archaeon SM23-78]MBW3001481.1 hypothetical protein [Candidatus Woesearchaeota archaeon]